jgi:hypothetical protein
MPSSRRGGDADASVAGQFQLGFKVAGIAAVLAAIRAVPWKTEVEGDRAGRCLGGNHRRGLRVGSRDRRPAVRLQGGRACAHGNRRRVVRDPPTGRVDALLNIIGTPLKAGVERTEDDVSLFLLNEFVVQTQASEAGETVVEDIETQAERSRSS